MSSIIIKNKITKLEKDNFAKKTTKGKTIATEANLTNSKPRALLTLPHNGYNVVKG